MTDRKWQRVAGEELTEAEESGVLHLLLPERSAIYMWKRNLRDIDFARSDSTRLEAWVSALVTHSNGRMSGRRLSHFLTVGTVDLRPAALTVDRRQHLARFFVEQKNRRWMVTYLESLGEHVPALYVGETGNLRVRIGQHLRGESDFGAEVMEDLELCWPALDLFYFDLGKKAEHEVPLRKTFEILTNAVTVGAFTRKPG